MLIAGLLLTAVGLLWFSQISVGGSYVGDVLFPSLLAAVGLGFAFVPMTIAAVAGVEPHEAGLASGLINTSGQVGGALGLAVLSTVAAEHTQGLIADGHGTTSALISGYHLAFFTGAAAIGAGIILALALLPRVAQAEAELGELPPQEEPDRARALELDRQAA